MLLIPGRIRISVNIAIIFEEKQHVNCLAKF